MSDVPERRARQGCYVVIGYDQYDYTDYEVGQYISLSRAKKAARNKARVANGDPTSFSDIFFVYDSAGACRYRVTFDDLPAHLRQPTAQVGLPEAVLARVLSYDRRFIKMLLLLLLIPALWQGKIYYDGMEITDKVGYADMRKRFLMDRPILFPRACDGMTWDHYLIVKRHYEEKRQPQPPRPKADYLRDKLRYYEEMDFEGPAEYGLLKAYVARELAQARPGETMGPDALHERNRHRYLSSMEKTLPMREELGRFLLDWPGDDADPVTNRDYRQLKRALTLCEGIVREEWMPSLAFLLANGNGDAVPLDGYEAEAFRHMIEQALVRRDVKQAQALHLALIRYQVMNWRVFFDTVQDSITRFSRFLDAHGLDKAARARQLEADLARLNPYDYTLEYHAYRTRTLQFVKDALVGAMAH